MDVKLKSLQGDITKLKAVGPIYRNGNEGEAELLASAYKNYLLIAEEKRLTSIAFPVISTGVYSYPLEEASEIATQTVREESSKLKSLKEIIFVSFDEQTFNIY